MWVRRCAEILLGSKVLVCTVVGFLLGASASEVKAGDRVPPRRKRLHRARELAHERRIARMRRDPSEHCGFEVRRTIGLQDDVPHACEWISAA